MTSVIGLGFSFVLIVLIFVIAFVSFFFFDPAEGFLRRSLFVVTGLLFPFFVVSLVNILKYMDLKQGRKISFQTSDYNIEQTKDGFVLKINSPQKTKFDLYPGIPPLIRPGAPLTVETTRFGKMLLFVSQNDENLLEKIEREDEKGNRT